MNISLDSIHIQSLDRIPDPAAESDPVVVLLVSCGLQVSDLLGPPVPTWVAAYQDEHLLGVCGIQGLGAIALLRSVAVDAGARGLGLGRLLVVSAERVAAEIGVVDLYLLTEDQRHFFELLDYRDVYRKQVPSSLRRHQQFNGGCSSSAFCMHKVLDWGDAAYERISK